MALVYWCEGKRMENEKNMSKKEILVEGLLPTHPKLDAGVGKVGLNPITT